MRFLNKTLFPVVVFSLCLSCTKKNHVLKENESQYMEYVKSWEAKQRAQDSTQYGFGFEDHFRQSGITFNHKIVEFAGKSYEAVHYDHGNGLAVADVNGDDLVDIYFVSQEGPNELWQNLGGGRFTKINSNSPGIDLTNQISVTASFADIDNDGDQDLAVSTVKMGLYLFENDGKGRFTNISQSAGFSDLDLRHSSGLTFFDYNRDGLLDLFVSNVGVYTIGEKNDSNSCYVAISKAFEGHLIPTRFEKSFLLKNLGNNKFKEVTDDVSLNEVGWSGDATIVDLNKDSYPELYVLNMQGSDHYWVNNQGKSFTDKTDEYFPKTSWGAMGVEFFDFNNDGFVDLYVTDMHTDMFAPLPKNIDQEQQKTLSEKNLTPSLRKLMQYKGKSVFGNSFYKGSIGAFEEVSDSIGVENYWPWGFSTGDLNADGYEDIFVAASMNYPFPYAINRVLINNQGENFKSAEFHLNVEPRENGRVNKEWFELDCSGQDKTHKHCSGQKGKVVVWGAVGTRSSALFDLDNDGDLDIVTNEFNDRPQILVSNLSEKKKISYLKVSLKGKKSNQDALGAHLWLKTNKGQYYRYRDGKTGYLSQGQLPEYFGLKSNEKPTQLEVLWPSGKRSTYPVTQINELLKVEEG